MNSRQGAKVRAVEPPAAARRVTRVSRERSGRAGAFVREMLKARRRGCLVGFALAVTTVALVIYKAFTVISDRVDMKSKTPCENQRILARELRQIAPEAQLEDDTCGLHTLRAIYAAYGIDPDKENLRTRLGLDVPSNPDDPESMGTLQFDMVRVLLQNGFDCAFMQPTNGAQLTAHLAATHMAALLIRRRQTGHLHWVAAAHASDRFIQVIDSLAPQAYAEYADDFSRDCILSGILISTSMRHETTPDVIRKAHHASVWEMLQTVARYRELSKNQKANKGLLRTGDEWSVRAPPVPPLPDFDKPGFK
jgi:hypothetical protein